MIVKSIVNDRINNTEIDNYGFRYTLSLDTQIRIYIITRSSSLFIAFQSDRFEDEFLATILHRYSSEAMDDF
jgi:hypothetical protein